MYDVAVIGAGPAGIAASIYLKRAGLDVTLFEKDEIGGLLLNAYLVENYPGFPLGIEGKQLCRLMKRHLKKWNIKPIKKEVKEVIIKKNSFILDTQGSENTFRAVILATGTTPKELEIPVEQAVVGKLVFYEIKEVLPKLKPGNVCAVIGGGDAAFDYALNLAYNGTAVEIYFRSKKPKCLLLLEDRVKKCNAIRLRSSFIPIAINKREGKLEIKFRSTGGTTTHTSKPDYVLIACGRNSNNGLIPKDLEKNNIPGLYIAGDVRTGKFRQIGIAVGEGTIAAMNVETYLRGLKT